LVGNGAVAGGLFLPFEEPYFVFSFKILLIVLNSFIVIVFIMMCFNLKAGVQVILDQ
jgi:hypothetical protein